MKPKKTTSVILVVALGISLLGNCFLLFRTAIIKSEYSWLRNTYETDTIETYKSQGQFMAQIEQLKGSPKEYIFDAAVPTMGIAVETFSSFKPSKAGNTDSWWHRIFNKSNKREPERVWYVNLKNQGLEALVNDHNRATQSFLKSEKP